MRILLLCMALNLPLIATADNADLIAELQANLTELNKRVAALEQENKALKKQSTGYALTNNVPAKLEQPSSKTLGERVRLGGDFRYRFEEIKQEGVTPQQRTRIRARAHAAVAINEHMEIGLGLATGGLSPTSSTQTLGNGGSKKEVALDLAYLDWIPVDKMHVFAGKFKNPLHKVPSQTLLWDDEWRPEGIGIQYDGNAFFASLLGTWLESDSLSSNREWATGAHVGIYRPIGRGTLTLGAGYFDFGTAGKGAFFGSNLDFNGNSFRCANPLINSSCAYVYDYRELEGFAALDIDIRNAATKIYGHVVKNTDANQHNIGWTLGVQLRTKQNHPLQFDYYYRELEPDAVFGLLSDSDFGGGGTDADGHYLKTSWWVNPNWVLSLTYHANRIGANTSRERDYERIQLNADFTF